MLGLPTHVLEAMLDYNEGMRKHGRRGSLELISRFWIDRAEEKSRKRTQLSMESGRCLWSTDSKSRRVVIKH